MCIKKEKVGFENCAISEITIAEWKYGVEKSLQKEKNRKTIERFQTLLNIIPVFPSLDIDAKEKARLKTIGKVLDDFNYELNVHL
ncbi:MAG TPA: hypothetical protein PLL63_02870 [Niabella sp.]|nr:hypothetical protein [Niabella sp.]